MSDTHEPLPPEVDAFLDAERRRPDPPAAIEDALLSRIGATLGWSGGSGPGGSDPPGGASGGHGGGGAQLAAHGAKHLAAGALAKTVATLVVGGVLGAGVHEAYDRTHDRRAEPAKVAAAAPAVGNPTPPPAVAPVAAPAPAFEPAAAPVAASGVQVDAQAKAARAPRGETRNRDRSLAAERGLIEQARSALAREKSAVALVALERHAREFQRGELEEERESLQVQVLIGLERFDEARKVAARFHRRFPRSIFGAVIDETIKSIPAENAK